MKYELKRGKIKVPKSLRPFKKACRLQWIIYVLEINPNFWNIKLKRRGRLIEHFTSKMNYRTALSLADSLIVDRKFDDLKIGMYAIQLKK